MRTYNVVICLHSRLIWITSLTHSSTSYWTRETFTQETRSEWRICLVPVEVIGKQPTLTCHVLVLQLLASLASTQETSANFQVASQLNKKLYWGVKIIPCSKLNCLVKVNQKYWKIVIANYFLQFIRYIYIRIYIYIHIYMIGFQLQRHGQINRFLHKKQQDTTNHPCQRADMLEVPRLEAVTNLDDMETEKGSHFAQGIHVPKSCKDVWCLDT